MPQQKVLLVENEFILYEELSEYFEEQGYSVIKHEDEERAVDNYEDAIQLLKQHEPDIAILDIKLNGTKDGIDLGTYIQQHYTIPVIYLSAHDNDGNLDRISKTGNDRFLIKKKPLDKAQLRATFKLVLPQNEVRLKRKTIGEFFKVKEMAVTQSTNNQRRLVRQPDDPLELQTFLKWEIILFIETYNASARGSGNNNVLIHTTATGKAYMLSSSLNGIEKQLPEYFCRFNQSVIVNLYKIDGRRSKVKYFIGDTFFEISEVYKAQALEKIARILGGTGLDNFPEK